MSYSKMERHAKLVNKLRKEQKIIVASVADELKVTPETIRRDFFELEERHLLTRVHGGAVKYTPLRKEPEFSRKLDIQKEAKRQIAKIAAERICDGDTIAIDVGTTTVHIADFIKDLNNVTVVTNSIAAATRFNRAIEEGRLMGKIILLGGITNPAQSSVAGGMTLEWLTKMRMDKVFLSCGGIDDGFVYDYDLDESLVSSTMMKKSNSCILVADGTKIAQQSFYKICRLDEVSEVICNLERPSEWHYFNGAWTIANGGDRQ